MKPFADKYNLCSYVFQAQYHFLILPKEKIPNLKYLKTTHTELLKYMESKGRKLADKYPSVEFR